MSNKNKDFNFEKFAVSIISIVDSLRSKGRAGAKASVESRINAFYRAIGLPAVITDVDKEIKKVDDYNNGNLFPEEQLPKKLYAADLLSRESNSRSSVSDDEVMTFLDMNEQDLLGGIKIIKTQKNARTRGKLFPMVADGSLEIYPQNRRVGSAFSTDRELTNDKVMYKRPFLEAVIAIRLKSIGATNSARQSNISLEVQKEIAKIGEELVSTLGNSTINVSALLAFAVKLIGGVRKKIGAEIKVNASNIAQEMPNLVKRESKQGELDKQKQQQDNERLLKQARLAIFNFDDTFGKEDKAKRKEGAEITKNLTDILFVSGLLGASVYDIGGATDDSTKEYEAKIKKQEALLKRAHKQLDLILGTFSGLSGTDVLAIFMALFQVEEDVLLSLLNERGVNNLLEARGTTISQRYPPDIAVTKLEEKVSEILTDMNNDAIQTKSRNKKERKK